MSESPVKLGRLFGISAGPGDPELLTLKGLKCLQAASVVAFPAGVRSKIGIAQRIVQPWIKPDQILLALDFPMVSQVEDWRAAWQIAADQTWPYLAQGQDVAFVSEGDVSFYSTYSYLAYTLTQAHPELQCEAIPGVCSPLASVAALGTPLTTGSDRLVILPAIYGVCELSQILQWAEVLVLMKVGSVYQQVWDQLQALDLLTSSALVIHASHPHQKIVKDLTHYRDLSPPYFSLMVIRPQAASMLSGVPLS